MPDPTLNDDNKEPKELSLCRTLAERILEYQPAIPDNAARHYAETNTKAEAIKHLIVDDIVPDFDKRLKELTARQTELFNTDGSMQEKILVLNEINEIQKKRKERS